VVTAAPVEMPAGLAALSAVNVTAPEAVGDSYAVVVRPDRYVAAVAADHPGLMVAADKDQEKLIHLIGLVDECYCFDCLLNRGSD